MDRDKAGTNEHTDGCHEHFGINRTRMESAGAGIEAVRVSRRTVCGHAQYRYCRRHGSMLQAAADIDARDVRQSDVEDDDVRRPGGGAVQSVLARGGLDDFEAGRAEGPRASIARRL